MGDVDDRARADPLLVLGLGTFHAAFFLALLVTLLHLNANVGGLLSVLDTVRGFALGGALWAASVWTTRRALRGVGVTATGFSAPVGTFLTRGFGWGSVTGVLFLAALLLVIATREGFESGFLMFGLLASPFALVLGGLVGLVLAAVDLLLAAVVARAV